MQSKPQKFQPVEQDSPARNIDSWNTMNYKTLFTAEDQGAAPQDAGEQQVTCLYMQCFKNPIFSVLLETERSQACDGRKLYEEKFQGVKGTSERPKKMRTNLSMLIILETTFNIKRIQRLDLY